MTSLFKLTHSCDNAISIEEYDCGEDQIKNDTDNVDKNITSMMDQLSALISIANDYDVQCNMIDYQIWKYCIRYWLYMACFRKYYQQQ